MKYLDDSVVEAAALTAILDKFSKTLHKVEERLTEANKYKLEFEYHADPIHNVFLSWRKPVKARKKKRCRVCIRVVDTGIDRPLGDLPIGLRIEYAKYLMPFLQAFKEHMSEKIDEMEDKVTQLKADMECY